MYLMPSLYYLYVYAFNLFYFLRFKLLQEDECHDDKVPVFSNFFFFLTETLATQARVFLPCLTFASEAGAYLTGVVMPAEC